MATNRVTRYLPVNRIAQQAGIPAACAFAAVPMILAGAIPAAGHADVYQAAYNAARKQVAHQRRLLEADDAWKLN